MPTTDDYFSVVDYYRASDLYLITSRSEGGPLSLTESWATGVPVVSTRVGMSADYIRDGENGFYRRKQRIIRRLQKRPFE